MISIIKKCKISQGGNTGVLSATKKVEEHPQHKKKKHKRTAKIWHIQRTESCSTGLELPVCWRQEREMWGWRWRMGPSYMKTREEPTKVFHSGEQHDIIDVIYTRRFVQFGFLSFWIRNSDLFQLLHATLIYSSRAQCRFCSIRSIINNYNKQ